MWNSRLGCLMPGRMPSPQIMDLIKSSFLSQLAKPIAVLLQQFRHFIGPLALLLGPLALLAQHVI
jgi:hypothetical protein